MMYIISRLFFLSILLFTTYTIFALEKNTDFVNFHKIVKIQDIPRLRLISDIDTLSMAGNYDRCIAIIDSALIIYPSDDYFLKKRCDIIALHLGYEEGTVALREIISEKKINFRKRTIKEVNDVLVRDEINSTIAASKVLKIKETKDSIHRNLIVIVSFIILIIFLLLYYIRSGKIKAQIYKSELSLKNKKEKLISIKNNLEMAKERATESSRLKSAFIVNMSHEIRTPLSAIVGFSEIMTDLTEDGSTQKKYADIIKDNSKTLLNVINDILELSRLDSGKYQPEFRQGDIAALFDDVISRYQSDLQGNLTLRFMTEHRPVMFETDLNVICRILNILIDNAIKFTLMGEVVVTLKKTKSGITFSVKDTGCGIDKKYKDAIFERFEKISDFSTGAGLGLSIAKSFTEMLEGNLELNPDYHFGAEFIVTIPVKS